MSSTGKWKVVAGVACLAVLAFAACNRDIGAPAAGAGGRGPLAEGSRVSGTLVETVNPLGSAPAFVPAPSRRDFSAVVEHGAARLDGATIALGRGFPRASSDVEFTDSEGRRARLVARAPAPGQPLQSFQVYRDGQLLVDVAFRWQDQGGAWVLRERTLTVYDHGRALLTHTRALDGASLASAGLRLPSFGRAGSLAAFLLPQRLEAETCIAEATMTVVAAGVVGAAAAQVVLTPTPLAFIALGMAISFYSSTMDAYTACLEKELPQE